MKKAALVLSLLFLVFLIKSSHSQNFYVKLGAGYGLGTNTGVISVHFDTSNVTGHYGSYGEGILPAIGFGYLFNRNIAVEVDGAYLIGKKFEHSNTDEFGNTGTHKQWGEGIIISPSLMVQVPMKSVTPYARFGGTIGIVKVKEEETQSGTNAETGTDKHEDSGSMGLGFNGAFGMKFKAGKMIDIFAEIFGQGMSYGPDTRENTETFTGGTVDPTITYEEEFALNTANTDLKPRHPFSNFGLNVGVTITFGKQPKVKK